MISLIIVITFFFILIVFYPTVSFVLSISGCLLKRFAGELIYKNEKIGIMLFNDNYLQVSFENSKLISFSLVKYNF